MNQEQAKGRGSLSERVKAFRKSQGWSAAKLGAKLEYSRSYVKAIEGRSLPPSAKFRSRFYALERKTYRQEFEGGAITSRYTLPGELLIYIKPRKCKVCKRWMLAPANQVTCDRATCKRTHAATLRRTRTQARRRTQTRKAVKRK